MKRLLAAICLALTGFATAMWLASRLGAGEGQGLAGGAIVLAYGLLGALVACAATWIVPEQWLARTLKLLFLPALLIAGVLIAGYIYSRQQTALHLEQAYAELPPFSMVLTPGPVFKNEQSTRLEADGGSREITLFTRHERCTGAINGKQTVKLLTALRAAELVTYYEPAPCGVQVEDSISRLSFIIEEATAGVTQADTHISANCLQRFPALNAPREAVDHLLNAREVSFLCESTQ